MSRFDDDAFTPVEDDTTEILEIVKALELVTGIPEIEQPVSEWFDAGYNFVRLGVEKGKIVAEPVDKDGNPTVSGPTAESSHIDGTGDKRRKKRKPVTLIPTDYQPVAKETGDLEPVETEERYTLSPWYVPDSLDAHGEWTDKIEVQRAFWKYLALDDRDIRLQHNVDVVAGRWVEGCTFPWELTVPVKHPEGDTEITFPSGTPFLGIIWEPWAWELIKDGEIRGLSIGGTAKRFEAELETTKDYEPTGKIGFGRKNKKVK